MTDHIRRMKAEATAYGLKPRKIQHQDEKPQRASYKNDVRPFVSGLGWALAALAFGISLSCYGLAVLAGLTDGQPWYLFALMIVGLTAIGYGVGAAAQVIRHERPFLERLWRFTNDVLELEPDKPPERVYLATPTGHSLIPGDVPHANRARFCRALVDGKATPSEASARQYGYSRQQWEVFRDYLIERGILTWKDAANHNAGLDITPGGYVALETIANG